jgi:dihydrolipoamide dehydrogenase
LEEVGVKTDRGRVVVDDFYKTNIEGVYAIGDIVKGKPWLTLPQQKESLVLKKSKGLHVEPIINNIPGCTYCSPEIASVGYTEKAAKKPAMKLKLVNSHSQLQEKLHCWCERWLC